jgi:hypothetical protein
LFAITS